MIVQLNDVCIKNMRANATTKKNPFLNMNVTLNIKIVHNSINVRILTVLCFNSVG